MSTTDTIRARGSLNAQITAGVLVERPEIVQGCILTARLALADGVAPKDVRRRARQMLRECEGFTPDVARAVAATTTTLAQK